MTNDEELHSLLADIEAWKDNLPADLQFRGPETPRNAGACFSFAAVVERCRARRGVLYCADAPEVSRGAAEACRRQGVIAGEQHSDRPTFVLTD